MEIVSQASDKYTEDARQYDQMVFRKIQKELVQ